MNININTLGVDLQEIIAGYNELNSVRHFDEDDDRKYEFKNQEDLVNTLVQCREIVVKTLILHAHIIEDKMDEIELDKVRDFYKRAGIRVTYAIVYHDLKNVFEILDIAVSDKKYELNIENMTKAELENIYVTLTSFILQTIKMFNVRFGLGGKKKRGPRKGAETSEEVH